MTVAVMPEAEDVDVDLREEDVRIDLYRASGAGGQHVNKTESAVRLTHIPTGLTVAIQDDRSQHRNKQKAYEVLRARLYQRKLEQLSKTRSDLRMSQIGRGERNERIRTYNYPDDRVTDHRSHFSAFGIEQLMAGEFIQDIIDSLERQEKRELRTSVLQRFSDEVHQSAKR